MLDKTKTNKTKANTPEELARFAELNSRAVTDEAKGLVDMLVPAIEDQQTRDGKRKHQRGPESQRALWTALEAFLGDLLWATTKEAAEGWCYRPMSQEDFSGERVSYRNFRAVADGLVSLGFVERRTGKQRLRKWEDGEYLSAQGFATRFRATEALLEVVRGQGIEPGRARDHFILQLPCKPLQLRDSSKRIDGRKVKGKIIRFERTEEALALEAEVKRLNEFLDGFDIRGGIHKGYRRIFNEGDHPDFHWNRGGRLYGGEDSYQRDPKEKRLLMTINGSPVVEIDISASYLTMLHGLSRVPFDPTQDPYEVEGIERRIVKSWTTATLGNNGHLKRWPSGIVDAYQKKTGLHLPSIVSTKQVREAMEEKHPILRDWDRSPINWAVLMYHESKAMVATMLELMALRIPSLAVHDSLIVRAADQETAKSVLVGRYSEVAGLRPAVKVNLAEVSEDEQDQDLGEA